jgi:small subunit ribosomal protein S3
MGQKVSPLIFRSRTFPYYKNIWQVSKDLTYKHKLNLSLYIKNLVKELIDKLEILGIRIKFYNNFYIKIIIILPKSVSMSSSLSLTPLSLKYLNAILKLKSFQQIKDLNAISNYKVSINFCVLKEPLLNPEILNYFILSQLKKGEPLRKILKQLSQIILISRKASSISIGGLKLLISGRIGGIQRARKETLLLGTVPLQTLNSKIKYSSSSIKTSYGTLGIKL